MIKRRLLSATLLILVTLFTVIPMGTGQFKVEASEAYKSMELTPGVVTASNVNLRTGPATTFDIICKLKKNQDITIIGKMGDWYAVYVGSSGNVGAITSQYVKVKEVKETTSKTNTKTASATPAKAVNTVTADAAKVKDISADEQALLDLINNERKKQGLAALEFDADLVNIARLKAKDMKDNNYFSHTSKFYGSPFDMMKKYNIKFSAAGENIAGNQTIEKAVKAWTNESGNNLYNKKFTHTGIGIVDSPTYGKIFVQMFIKKT
ncbi:SH3 domain-containing protein [Ruminiclostridium herbifermentans]|uniref:SH3 domain-containing protein n=1 Tax=Ruminiclostridium herbifermentans TaxID=2488810 RepID=A0A4V6ENT4_9FIRM|nr:CAP domain-containing protein [Ruminiclostridium herbifermentans]QNU67551.1 SH3 domain-containing protein [Ruminiclostridium herbifermentans]